MYNDEYISTNDSGLWKVIKMHNCECVNHFADDSSNYSEAKSIGVSNLCEMPSAFDI